MSGIGFGVMLRGRAVGAPRPARQIDGASGTTTGAECGWGPFQRALFRPCACVWLATGLWDDRSMTWGTMSNEPSFYIVPSLQWGRGQRACSVAW